MLNSTTYQKISKPKSFSGTLVPRKYNIRVPKLTNSVTIQGNL